MIILSCLRYSFPEILESTHELFAQSYVLPDEALKETVGA